MGPHPRRMPCCESGRAGRGGGTTGRLTWRLVSLAAIASRAKLEDSGRSKFLHCLTSTDWRPLIPYVLVSERQQRVRQPNSTPMKALVCTRLGKPTEELGSEDAPLHLAHVPPPPLVHPSAVRIRVAAASINFADALQIEGSYQEVHVGWGGHLLVYNRSLAARQQWAAGSPTAARHWAPCSTCHVHEREQCTVVTSLPVQKPKLPFIPGSECSGIVTECGRDVRTVAVGDRVSMCFPFPAPYVGEYWGNTLLHVPGGGACPFATTKHLTRRAQPESRAFRPALHPATRHACPRTMPGMPCRQTPPRLCRCPHPGLRPDPGGCLCRGGGGAGEHGY